MKLSKRTISNFATYFFGVAIGLILVGMILRMKQQFVQPPGKQGEQQTQQPEASDGSAQANP